MKSKNVLNEENNEERKVIRLCGDVIFKAVFLRERDILLKMLCDIIELNDNKKLEEVLTGYELEPYKLNGKTNKSDMLIKLSKNNFVNCEINYKHEKDVLFRNMLQLFRICIQVTESGMTDKELSLKKFIQLNFNTFGSINNKEIQRCKYRDDEGNVVNNFITIWNFNIEKCHNMVYNDIDNAYKLPKMIRWGALLYTDIRKTKEIEKILEGDDLLDMENKVKLIDRINNVKDDKTIIQEWMVEENNRMRDENALKTAREDGYEKGIEKGIKKGIEQGIEKGTRQGEEKNRIEIIKNMLKKNTDYEYISDITGKSIYEIKQIEKELLIPNV